MNPAAGDMTNISWKRELGEGRVRAGTVGMGCLWWRRVERVNMPPMESPEREICRVSEKLIKVVEDLPFRLVWISISDGLLPPPGGFVRDMVLQEQGLWSLSNGVAQRSGLSHHTPRQRLIRLDCWLS